MLPRWLEPHQDNCGTVQEGALLTQNAAPEPSLGVRIEAAGSLLAQTASSAALDKGKRGAHAEWLTLGGTSSSAEASISTRTKPFPPEPSPIVIS
jgi:hypothetical protein